ncbi:hypothetical protein DAI22_01g074600 [Oryza sativa Japonica Group]|nr:hypothetical protein DAI22_01g074600 [Oryza sativa Japonica Group]
MPLPFICSKRAMASLPRPCMPYPAIMMVHEIRFLLVNMSNKRRASSNAPHLTYMSTSALATKLSSKYPLRTA